MLEHISKNIDITNLKMSKEAYYNSIVFCIIDAIYSINAKYASTKNTVMRYCQGNKLERYRKYGSLPVGIENEHTINDFKDFVCGECYEGLANSVFNNRQRTSTRSGILKAQAVCEFAEILHYNEINCFSDIPKMYGNPQIGEQVKGITGQASGLSLSYFYMLTGSDDFIKADRHILNFIYEATGQRVSKQQAEILFAECVERLKDRNPDINCRSLDHAVWRYMSSKK